MKIVLIVAQSLDGFITRHDEPGAGWASAADQKWFRAGLRQFDAQVMARKTYETVRDEIKPDAADAPVRMVMTRDPATYAPETIPQKLEFSDAGPAAIIAHLREAGCEACALLGGATVHDLFLDAGLVDELWVTVEPRLFGTGTPVVANRRDQQLKLIAVERLPDSDSVVLKYRPVS